LFFCFCFYDTNASVCKWFLWVVAVFFSIYRGGSYFHGFAPHVKSLLLSTGLEFHRNSLYKNPVTIGARVTGNLTFWLVTTIFHVEEQERLIWVQAF
jgi:hypothetical protein